MLSKRRGIIEKYDIAVDPFQEGSCGEIHLILKLKDITPEYTRNFRAPMHIITYHQEDFAKAFFLLLRYTRSEYLSEIEGKTITVEWDTDKRVIDETLTLRYWRECCGMRK